MNDEIKIEPVKPAKPVAPARPAPKRTVPSEVEKPALSEAAKKNIEGVKAWTSKSNVDPVKHYENKIKLLKRIQTRFDNDVAMRKKHGIPLNDTRNYYPEIALMEECLSHLKGQK